MDNQSHNESALEKWERRKAEGLPITEHILSVLKARFKCCALFWCNSIIDDGLYTIIQD